MTEKATMAAVSTIPVRPGKLDEVVQLMQELVPTTLPGLQRVHFLVDREKNEMVSIAYYETRAAAIAPDSASAQATNREAFERIAKLVTGQVERTLYEVAAVLERDKST